MRPHRIIHILTSLACCMLLFACSNSKRLADGESLFIGSKVNIKDFHGKKSEKKLMQNDLAAQVRPRPNKSTLGMRLKLTIYNFAGNPRKEKGFRNWLRTKAGEPPVLGSSVRTEANKALAANYLENRGYFTAKVSARLEVNKKKKAKLVMDVLPGNQYTLESVRFRNDSSEIAHDIDSSFSESLLKPGGPYNLTLIKAERTRIDRMLKEKGYFYFTPEYILIVADTGRGDNKIRATVQLKHREIPPEAYTKYTINDIYIFANYRLQGTRQDTNMSDRVKVDEYYVVDPKHKFKPQIFSQAMIFEKGDLYSLDDQNKSLSRLVNMGTFKFVKNRFEPVQDTLLDVFYYLTPFPKKSLRFEIGALTQNDNRAGTRGTISWKNRNTFKGAEELLFKINGGVEAQYSGEQKRPNIYNFGAELNLAFPRFVVPFINVQTQSQYLPRTLIKLKYNYEFESQLLRINSYTASYGYNWKEGPRKEHQLFPFNFTYVKTDTLGLNVNRLLYGNLLFDGIIVGPTYEFTYNSQVGTQRKHAIYFDGLIDLSGNILGLVQKADYATNPKELFGQPYAQYIKAVPDFRYYFRPSRATTLAVRLLTGFGLPYGNSAQLPNIKQFWAGGNSDLRGFPSRLAGPGTFDATQPRGDSNVSYIQTLGDIKLEGNIELRQNLYKFLNGALFVDAGNIWLYRDNTSFPGGKFTNNFYKEFNANMGAGLRFDFSILVLRLDLGIPIRKAWLPEDERWVFNKINFSDKDWRRQNMILNIAIGYPF